MSNKIFSIGFDADDTLWHCEDKFVEAHNKLNKLFPGRSIRELTAAISEIELKNIELYGFGVKSFTLSLIETYLKILNNHTIAKQNFIMIGNSIRSDIQPVLNIGSRAIHIPYKYTWMYENAVESPINEHYTLLGDINLVPSWLDQNT